MNGRIVQAEYGDAQTCILLVPASYIYITSERETSPGQIFA